VLKDLYREEKGLNLNIPAGKKTAKNILPWKIIFPAEGIDF
jgi:hypothetical protein